MLRFFFLFMVSLPILSLKAQTVADFESLPLSASDSFYVNYSQFGQDVGFSAGLAHFPCVYDTSWGYTFLSRGFVYSNLTDSLTGNFSNQYASITGSGVHGSNQYAVGFGERNVISLQGQAAGKPVKGFYLANSTFSWHTIKYGDPNFGVDPFGGPGGEEPDWFKLIIKGYTGGALGSDSLEVFLADYRFADSAQDTVYRGWRWVDLLPLGKVDSLYFQLASSDTGQFGINTPLYFCMDDFTTLETAGIPSFVSSSPKAYPNPFHQVVRLEAQVPEDARLRVYNSLGQLVLDREWERNQTEIPVGHLPAGTYIFRLSSPAGDQAWTMLKQ